MKIMILALFLSLPALFAESFTLGEHSFHQQVLENGLVAIALQSTNELADIYLSVDVGRRHENPDINGIAHMTEHAMFAGTEKVPPQAFEKRIRAFGGRANAFTREDYTLYYDVKIPMDQLDLVLDMEADRLVNLTFEESAFRFEQERLKKEEAGDDRVGEQLQTQSDALVFPGHAYGAGQRIEGFTRAPELAPATVHAFYKLHYHPRNTAVLIVSREVPARTLKRIEAAFSELPAGPDRPPSRIIQPNTPLDINEAVASGLRQRRVEYLWRTPPLGHADHHASLLLAELIGNRGRAATNHTVNIITGNRLDGDSMRIWATGDQAETKLEAFIANLREQPFTESEHQQATQDLADDFLQLKIHSRPYFSLPARIAQYASNKQPGYIPKFSGTVRAIPLERIQELAQTMFAKQKHAVVTFKASGKLQALPEDPRALAKFAADAQEAGQHAEAIEAYSRLLEGKLNTMFQIIYLASRGQVYLDSRDFDAAIADFKVAMQLSDYPALPPLLEEAERLKAASMARSNDSESTADAPEPEARDLKQELFDLIPKVSAELEAWRGLSFKTPVTVTFTNNPPEEKLGGWYDSETKQLVVSVQDDRPQFSKGVLYHELFHALQDQHYDLMKLHLEADNQDAQRALTAVIEGEAMYAVSELMDYNFLAHADIRDKGPIPPTTFEKKFHYGAGLRFIMHMKEKSGWAGVSRIFQHLPGTTREIYHPEQYPVEQAPKVAWPKEAKEIITTGMYDVRWLLTRPQESRKDAIHVANLVTASSQATLGGKTIWQLHFDSPAACSRAREVLTRHADHLEWTVDSTEGSTLRLLKR